jgi:hypothetical protein
MIRLLPRAAFPAICLLISLGAARLATPPAFAQKQQLPARDLVANFAAGRVEICAAKDTLLVAAADEPLEPGSVPPQIFLLGTGRIGVLLGAVEWIQPGSGQPPDRFAQDLSTIGHEAPLANNAGAGVEATDIETLGIALLERVRAQAETIHHKLDMAPDEPLVQLIVADYVDNYGFEAWLVRYNVKQEDEGDNYWTTRIQRPDYEQIYPPQKGMPRTFFEVRYPPASVSSLLERLQQNDPVLERIRTSSPQLDRATSQILAGDSPKSAPDDDSDFLRAALPVITHTGTHVALVEITEGRDVVWVVGEPSTSAPAAPQQKNQPSDSDAPSLYKH